MLCRACLQLSIILMVLFWSEVISADIFAAFEEAGLDNSQAMKQVGKRYRDTFLALGGSRYPGDVFRDFRGRDPRTEALIRHMGITGAE